MLVNWHWNNLFQENSLSSWQMQVSEVLVILSWSNITLTRKFNQSGKCTPLWRLDQKFFNRATQMSINLKEFLAVYKAILEFAHILWKTTKPTIVPTDNKSVTRFVQTNAIPPALWNACDYLSHFNYKIAGPANHCSWLPLPIRT